jgi:hypothetical protein
MPKAGLITIRVGGWEVRGGVWQRRIKVFDLHLPLLPTQRRLAGVGDNLSFPLGEGVSTPTLIFQPILADAM